MAGENPRIAELQRRVQSDPASIAFAQLAEEHRRAGYYDEAVKCCRTGLARHPGYLSARVTLGRALIELGSLEEAVRELELVLRSAPDNLAAIRGMAEIHQRRGNLEPALDFYKRALTLARHDPELEETVGQIGRELGTVSPSGPTGLSFLEAHSELLSAGSRMPAFARPEPDASFGEASLSALSAPLAPSKPEGDGGSDQPPLKLRRSAEALAKAEDPPLLAIGTFGAPAAPSAPSVPSAPSIPVAEPYAPVDFDALLRSLGAPDATPPPVMEMLLTEPAPPVARPEPVLPELPPESLAGDPFAALERDLRAFDRLTADAPAPPADTTSVVILAELEAWLTAIQQTREDPTESA